jgi:hypothetical protein
MEMRSFKYFVGTTAAIGLLLTAAGHAWMQGEQATDGKSLAGESASTQGMFRATYGADADREWVAEHNAEVARLAPAVPAVPVVPEPPIAAPPIAMPPDMVMTTPAGTAMTTPVATSATAVATSATAVATSATAVAGVETVVTTPGAAGATSGSPSGAPTAAAVPPTAVPGAQATAQALPRVGVEPTPFPRVNR